MTITIIEMTISYYIGKVWLIEKIIITKSKKINIRIIECFGRSDCSLKSREINTTENSTAC